jgi:ATP-dependent exoDNAse (exonuclease V) alpha subunit
LDTALDALAGPDGLTGQASTFTRTDVVDALVKRLPVAASAQQALGQAEAAADRFLGERAVRVARDRRLGVERFSTPELLALERRLVDGATARTGERCAVVRPELVRQVLDRHQTAGEDQAAMVHDVCHGGDGVAVVVGRAGSGKTWALGLAREAFELAGYQVLGTAPTGIATVGLAEEGFTDTRTVDRLLLDLSRGRVELDDQSVLVVDEAAMVATRKLAPLLQHAERAGAKVVLVGDDRQFAPIATGGGFRALRQRLGASELTVNRRQVEAWEQRAIEDVRAGNLERAIAAYAEHDRIQAFEARDDRDRALVSDWWQGHQQGDQPVIYAHRRAQVDHLNQVCQRLRAEHGQLGPERLVVGDRNLAVGDVVVFGANAKDRLGVVNGTTAVYRWAGPTWPGDDGANPRRQPLADRQAARLVPGRPGAAGAVAAGRLGLRPDRHALPRKDRAAGAASPGRRRGHAGRLRAAHQEQAAHRPIPCGRPRAAQP